MRALRDTQARHNKSVQLGSDTVFSLYSLENGRREISDAALPAALVVND